MREREIVNASLGFDSPAENGTDGWSEEEGGGQSNGFGGGGGFGEIEFDILLL